MMIAIRTAVALTLAAGLLAAFAQSASSSPKHHKQTARPKVEYLRAAGSPK